MFSRDERTRVLFRKSWEAAAINSGADLRIFCRNFGLFNLLKSICRFIFAQPAKRVVFGTTEILLYALFSTNKDVWVFTGLGRLLLKNDSFSDYIKIYLRMLYKKQLIVVLNVHDSDFICSFIAAEPVVLEGEGYPFKDRYKEKEIKSKTSEIKFAYVGRLLKSKGVDKLVEVFSVASQKDWTLLVVGDADFSNMDSVSRSVLKNSADRSVGKIIYTGFSREVSSILESVDVLISMSEREGLPFAILDGVVSGAHLVLSPVPGHLAFSGLPGVTFVKPDNLSEIFHNFSVNPLMVKKFDGLSRYIECKKRFGQTIIIEKIKMILNS